MAKVIKNLIENIKGDLKELGFPAEVFTMTGTIYTRKDNNTHTGNIRVALCDVIDALDIVNKRINKVSKLEKRIEALEKKIKK
jgi:hypothetical protein